MRILASTAKVVTRFDRRLLLLAVSLFLWHVLTTDIVRAQSTTPDTACILCHSDRDDQITLPSGETLNLGVELGILNGSVHGTHAAESVYCTDCHADRQKYRFPHIPNPSESRAEFSAEVEQNCERCHTTIEAHNPGHLQATSNPNLPGCTNCHGGHDVELVESMQADPIGACTNCHEAIGEEYAQNLHDEFIANMQPDQSCESCHGPAPLPVNAQCETCHSMLSSELTLASGETIPLHVDPHVVLDSVHGERTIEGVDYSAVRCVDCHQDMASTGYPHTPTSAETKREYTIGMESLCQECHTDIFDEHVDDVHLTARQEGNLEAATCIDCHGSHEVQNPVEPRQRVSETCGQCHADIHDQFVESVHGAALMGENNPDVPVCTDCHGVHQIASPQSARFRVESPTMCGECHADKELMAQYGISTDVFDTYVADFHGTTVALFEKQSPDQETNKAVCYDCHGVHDILPVNDENSTVIKENLLETCRECHPNASANFPDAWTSHYQPSLEHNPIVYIINQFYAIVIPVFVGGFALFIGTDVYRRFRIRRRKDPEE